MEYKAAIDKIGKFTITIANAQAYLFTEEEVDKDDKDEKDEKVEKVKKFPRWSPDLFKQMLENHRWLSGSSANSKFNVRFITEEEREQRRIKEQYEASIPLTALERHNLAIKIEKKRNAKAKLAKSIRSNGLSPVEKESKKGGGRGRGEKKKKKKLEEDDPDRALLMRKPAKLSKKEKRELNLFSEGSLYLDRVPSTSSGGGNISHIDYDDDEKIDFVRVDPTGLFSIKYCGGSGRTREFGQEGVDYINELSGLKLQIYSPPAPVYASPPSLLLKSKSKSGGGGGKSKGNYGYQMNNLVGIFRPSIDMWRKMNVNLEALSIKLGEGGRYQYDHWVRATKYEPELNQGLTALVYTESGPSGRKLGSIIIYSTSFALMGFRSTADLYLGTHIATTIILESATHISDEDFKAIQDSNYIVDGNSRQRKRKRTRADADVDDEYVDKLDNEMERLSLRAEELSEDLMNDEEF